MLSVFALVAITLSAGRHVIDLDQGWEYVRVPKPPSVWSGVDAVPTSQWKVVSVSSQETSAEKANAELAFYGDPNTFWHTEWSKRKAPYPHEITIDLGSSVEAIGLRLLPRQTGPQNGRPNHFQLYLSDDLSKMGKPVLAGAVPDSGDIYEKRFQAAKGRFMKLVFLDGHRPGEPFLALSEIGLIRNLDLTKRTGWQSQYDITNIQTGERRFDPNADDLQRLKTSELHALSGTKWESANLPHAAWIRPLNHPEIWQGVAYYRRHLKLPPQDPEKHFEFKLDGAMQSSDLWLNGKYIASQRGGYLPMVVDLTGKLKPDNELLVRVDNSDNPLIPPGKPQSQLDFMYGSGLTRHASLTVTGPIYITDGLGENRPRGGGVAVSFPSVTPGKATVRVRTVVRNTRPSPRNITVTQELMNQIGQVNLQKATQIRINANAASEVIQDLIVAQPRLWSTGSPKRYRLRTNIQEQGRVLDSVQTEIGIRKIEVSRSEGLKINGKPLKLVGTNRHQDYPWVGPALSDAANRRDALLIKRSGHNIVRLSHYPQSEAFLDACDEFGILTIPCIPGWQFINRDPRFSERVIRDIKQLVRRDRNHPSVAFWEASLNETYPGAKMAKEWYDTAKSEALDDDMIVAGDGTKGAPWDVAYNGWKEDLSRPQDGEPDRPGYIREYGDYEFGGAYSTSRVKIGQGIDKLLQETWNHVWSYNKFRPQYPWTMGAGTWEMFDHNVPWEFSVSASGLADIFRREKPSFWFYESQQGGRPFLRIAATWQPGAPKRDIIVFTNCEEAALSVNGHWIARSKPALGLSTSYGSAKPFDGSNTESLAYPPIVIRNVPFAPGTLSVVGLNHGTAITKDTIHTSGKPASLKVWLDDLGIPATTNDLVFVRAALVDNQGNICTDTGRRISFKLTGASLAGEPSAQTEMGIASVLVRTQFSSGLASVQANTEDGLTGHASFSFGR